MRHLAAVVALACVSCGGKLAQEDAAVDAGGHAVVDGGPDTGWGCSTPELAPSRESGTCAYLMWTCGADAAAWSAGVECDLQQSVGGDGILTCYSAPDPQPMNSWPIPEAMCQQPCTDPSVWLPLIEEHCQP
jgi:hypothetical protein